MKKNNPTRRAGEKKNLAPILSEKKYLGPNQKPKAPPEYQIDRVLEVFVPNRINGYQWLAHDVNAY